LGPIIFRVVDGKGMGLRFGEITFADLTEGDPEVEEVRRTCIPFGGTGPFLPMDYSVSG
jgi:hypothetical protein